MKIIIGTKNKAKVSAVKEVLRDYEDFTDCEMIAREVDSGVADQPKSIEETVLGVQNRAKVVFNSGDGFDYGFGIESGLMAVPASGTGYLDICICAIYNGEKFATGISCGFECPTEVTQLMIEEGLDMSQAANKAGLSTNPKLGAAEGLIGILTKGRITRKDYTKQAIITAMVQIENKELY
jgi:inosine/xanthosine triphosphatase